MSLASDAINLTLAEDALKKLEIKHVVRMGFYSIEGKMLSCRDFIDTAKAKERAAEDKDKFWESFPLLP